MIGGGLKNEFAIGIGGGAGCSLISSCLVL